MSPPATFGTGCDLAAEVGKVMKCLLDPAQLGRCIPGASLTVTDGRSVNGLIRLKQGAVPSVYDLHAELTLASGGQRGHPDEALIAAEGVAEERRSGTPYPFRILVRLSTAGPGRSRCRITAELPDGDATQRLFDRLTPQFLSQLEDVARGLPGSASHRVTGDEHPTELRRYDGSEGAEPPRRVVTGWIALAACLTGAVGLFAWVALRRRRRVDNLSLAN